MFRVKITAMFMATMIAITPITAQAAAIPYMPPSDAYIWGYIYNALGVTALDDTITDKAQKYWDFYASLVNGVNSALYEDMKQVFHKAKTGRKIELSPAQTSVLQELGKKAIQNGVTTEQVNASVPSYQELIAWIDDSRFQYSESRYNQFVSKANQNIGVGQWTMIAIISGQYTQNGNPNKELDLYAYDNTWHMKQLYNGTYSGKSYSMAYFKNGVEGNYYNIQSYITWQGKYKDPFTQNSYAWASAAYGFSKTNDWGEKTETQLLAAQNQSIIDALINGVDLILTAHSQVVDGSVDDTKPIVIDLPITLPVPAVTVPDLPAVQDDLGVLPLPLTEDPAETVQEMQATQTASLGTTADYQLDLTELFPFCIPFDIARVIGLFVAEPQTPAFTFAFPVGYEDGELVIQNFTMDLAALDGVAVWVRRGMLAVFVVGLGMVTRQVFLRG